MNLIINCGDIVYCKDYKVSNDRKASRHPYIVLVINNTHKLSCVVCTDKAHEDKFQNTYEVDYRAAHLQKPTVAICSKMLILDTAYIDKVIGKISYSDFCNITNRVARMENHLSLIEKSEQVSNNKCIEVSLDIEENIHAQCIKLEEAFRRMYNEGNVLTHSEMVKYLRDHGDTGY